MAHLASFGAGQGVRRARVRGDGFRTIHALIEEVNRDPRRGEGHEPVVPPVLVREEALEGTGFLPGDRDQIYEIPKDELFLTGTSEVALAGLHVGGVRAPVPGRRAAGGGRDRGRRSTPRVDPRAAARHSPGA